MANRTIQLPNPVFESMSALKIRLAGTIGKIPTNGDVIQAAITVAESHYDELLSALTPETKTET